MKLSLGYQADYRTRIHSIFVSCQYVPAPEICQLRQCFQVFFLRFTTYQDYTLVCFIRQNHDWREPYAMAPKRKDKHRKRTTKIIQSPQEHQNLRHKSVKTSCDQSRVYVCMYVHHQCYACKVCYVNRTAFCTPTKAMYNA